MTGEAPKTVAPQDPQGLQQLERDLRTQQARTVSSVFRSAMQTDPAVEAERKRLSFVLGVPPEQLPEDTTFAAQEAKVKEAQSFFQTMENDRMRRLFEDLPFVRLLHDDLGNLKDYVGTFDWVSRNYESGATINEAGLLKAKLALAHANNTDLSPGEKDRLAEIDYIQRAAELETGIFDEATKLLGQMIRPSLQAVAFGGATAAAGSALGPGGAAAGFTYGTMSAFAAQAAVTEFGHQYESTYRSLIDAGVDPKEAQSVALQTAAAYGVGSAALETLGFGPLLKPFTGAGAAVGRRLLAKGGLSAPPAGRAAGGFVKDTLRGGLSETFTEGGQELLASIAENVAGAMTDTDIGPTVGEALTRAGEVMLKTAKGMAVLAPIGPALHYAADLEQVKKAKTTQEFFTQLAEKSKKVEVLKRSPETLSQLVEARTIGTEMETVFIEGPKLIAGLQQAKITREQFAQTLPEVAKQLDDAERTGDDVAIPMGEFAAKIAATDLYPAIQNAIRFKNGWSPEQADVWMTEQAANREAAMQKVAAEAAKVSDWADQATAVEQRFLDELAKDTRITSARARDYAAAHRQWVEVHAAAEGKTPKQFDEEHKLVLSVTAGGAQKLQQFVSENVAGWEVVKRKNEMVAAGASPKEILAETGLQQGTEGAWMFEIDDSKSKWQPKLMPSENDLQKAASVGRPVTLADLKPEQWTTLDSVLDHPELFEKVPSLKKVGMRLFTPEQSQVGEKGYYHPIKKEVALRSDLSLADGFRILHHEIQHAIQDEANFARGGSPGAFSPRELAAIERSDAEKLVKKSEGTQLRADVDEFLRLDAEELALLKQIQSMPGRGDDRVLPLRERLKGQLPLLRNAFAKLNSSGLRLLQALRSLQPGSTIDAPRVSSFDAYRRLAGETQARNTADQRLHLTAEERRRQFAGETADVPPDEQIVRPGEMRLSQAEPAEITPRQLKRLWASLTPTERTKVKGKLAEKVMAVLADLPSAKEVAAVAEAGKAKRGWYARSAATLSAVFGSEATRFARLLAAMSPQNPVEANLRNALRTWVNWKAAGMPADREAILDVMGRSVDGSRGRDSVLDAWINNSVRALSTGPEESVTLSGPKVNSFYLNLVGVTEEVTNDAWIANFAFVDQAIFGGSLNVTKTDPGKGPGYLAMNVRIREAATQLSNLTGETWTPAEVQETVWSWAKTLYELQTPELSATRALTEGHLTDDLIAGTPDFATLLTLPDYAGILAETYGDKLEDLRREAAVPQPTTRSGGQAEAFAPEARREFELKAARRLERLFAQRARDKAATLRSRAAGEQAGAGAVRDGRGVRGSDQPVDVTAGPQPESPRLEGLEPTVRVGGRDVAFGPSAAARQAAIDYMREAGLPFSPPTAYAPVDPERAKRIAAAFDAMKHAPDDPDVRAAYTALASETVAQYRAMLAAGVTVEFNQGGDPYGNPRNALLDLQDNNHLFVFSTEDGYGGVPITDAERAANPLLAESGFYFGDRPALVNDLFRAVHDYFGHFKEGVGFRARGEENAWQQHMAMFSPLARRAATTETRGQNSWVNFGPHAEANKTASGAATVYAEQKIGLLPDWVLQEGYLGGASRLSQLDATSLRQDEVDPTQQPRGEFEPSTNTIFLHEKADATTVLHEMSHFWMTTLFKIASQPTASARVKQDADTLLKWFGVKDLATWNGMTLAEQKPHHEAFAYNAEAHWFGESKSPTADPEMRRLFRTFGRWVRAVYRHARDVLNATYRREFGKDLPSLTPDVRAVFDRMLASEDAIAAAKSERSLEPMATTKPEDMSDEDWRFYLDSQHDSVDEATEELQRESLRAMRWVGTNEARIVKQLQKSTRAARKKIEAEVRAQLEAQPVYRARTSLRSGEVALDDGSTVPLKLRAFDFHSHPMGDATREPAMRSMLREDGQPADLLAPMFGFPDGYELVRALIVAPDIDSEVQRLADERMLAEHSDLLDPAALRLKVEKALHNDARMRMAAAELKWLAKITTPVRLMVRAAREFARDAIGKQRIGDVKPYDHALAEVRFRREASRALAKGDHANAALAKRRELLEAQKERVAIEVRGEIESTRELVKKLFRSDKKLAGSRDVDYVAVARYLASAFHLIDTGETLPASYLEKVRAYNPQLIARVEPILERARRWAEGATRDGRPITSWRDLTVDEFRDLSESIDALWNQSLREQQFQTEQRLMTLEDVATEIQAQDAKSPPAPPQPLGDKTTFEKLGGAWHRLKQLIYRPEHWALRKDGGEEPGAFTRYFWRPVRAAVDRYVTSRNTYTKRITKMVQALRPKLKQGLIEFRDTNGQLLHTFGRGNGGLGHAELIAALLHTGNASNLERLLTGRRWGALDKATEVLDVSHWNAFLQQMIAQGYVTKDVMDFVQSVWDLNEEVKPLAQRAHRALFGFYFNEIEATEIKLSFGTYRGGYAPAKLDPSAPSYARNQSLADREKDFRQQFASTGRGFTKARAEHFGEPLLLDLDLVPSHIDDVLRFSHLQPVVRDVERLAKHSDVAAMLEARQPGVWQNMLLPWLQRVAAQTVTKPGMNSDVDRFWSFVRSSAGISTMFANVGNALQQVTGVLVAALKVKPRYLFRGFGRLLRERTALYEDIAEKSKFMRNRQGHQLFDDLDTIEELTRNRSKLAKARAWSKKHAYFLQSRMQNMVDSVVWSAAYEQSLAASKATTADADAEAAAITAADAAVRQTQSSFEPTDVAGYEHGTPFYRLLTMFAGYFNTLANLQADRWVALSKQAGWAKAGPALYLYLLGFALPTLMADAITRTVRGQWDDEDDDGDVDVLTLDYLFLGQLRAALAQVPVAGPAVLAPALNAFDNQPWNDRMTTSPAITTLERAAGGSADAIKTLLGLSRDRSGAVVGPNGETVRDILSALGLGLGVPAGAVGNRAGYATDVAGGRISPAGTWDMVRGLISGAAGKQATVER